MLDINMPVMDGFEACLKIDEHLQNAKTSIYALTSDYSPEILKKVEKFPFKKLFSCITVSDINEIVN